MLQKFLILFDFLYVYIPEGCRYFELSLPSVVSLLYRVRAFLGSITHPRVHVRVVTDTLDSFFYMTILLIRLRH